MLHCDKVLLCFKKSTLIHVSVKENEQREVGSCVSLKSDRKRGRGAPCSLTDSEVPKLSCIFLFVKVRCDT